MSEVINPPDYYFTGINFNPAFYADDTGGGLSEATANTLYLRKTVPDTANVVETFTKDIICTEAITAKDDLVATTASAFMSCTTSNPKIDLIADTGRSIAIRTTSIQVGASSPLDIATYVDVDLNVGTGGRTGLGTGPSPFIIHNYSDGNNCLAGNNVHLNNGTNNLSNTAIHNGTSSGGAVNIMTGTSSTGTVNIGATGTTTNLNGTVKSNTIAGIATTGTQSLYGTKTSGTLNIATSQTSGTINIGSGIGPVTNISGQLLCGSQPSATNACLSVGSNSTCPNGIINWAYNDANGILSCFNSVQVARGGVQGVNSTTIAFPTTSDRRLKTNIKPMKPMLETIMLMKPSEYGWISNDDTGYGFIAQEVHQLFPEMRYGANGCEDIENPCNCETGEPVYYGLDYGKFTPYIVKAVQELKEDYDAKLKFQDAKLANLEAKLLDVLVRLDH